MQTFSCNPHDFPSWDGIGIMSVDPGDECRRCGIIFCPVAYDHEDDEPGGCAVCGWDGT